MIAKDLCQLRYQILLITYLEFMIKNVKNAWKEKKNRLNCEFVGFKNGRLNYKCKECKKLYTKVVNVLIKKCPTLHAFCNGDFNTFFSAITKRYKYLMKIKYHLKKLFTAN